MSMCDCGECEDCLRGLVSTLRSRLAEAERDRDEARDWVRRMHAESQVLTCVFCGEAYPPGTAASGEPALVAHVNVCSKHPLAAERAAHEATKRDLEAVRTRGANAVLVPTDKLAELRAAKEQAEAALADAEALLVRVHDIEWGKSSATERFCVVCDFGHLVDDYEDTQVYEPDCVVCAVATYLLARPSFPQRTTPPAATPNTTKPTTEDPT